MALSGLAAAAEIEAVRRDIEALGVRALHHPADLRQPDDVARLVDEAGAAMGSIDILVNNAVVRHSAPVEAFPAAAWDEAMAVNLSAPFHAIRAALPSMRRRGWGRIVNVSSIYGLKGGVNRAAYVTTKTALVGLTRAVALETSGSGVTCNAVCPGTSETPVHEASIRAAMERSGLTRADAEQQFLAGRQPSGRLVSAQGVAALIAFLCGSSAADITGAILPIDGGWSAA